MKKNQNKISMANDMGPFRDSQAPFLALRAPAMYRLNPPLIGPACTH